MTESCADLLEEIHKRIFTTLVSAAIASLPQLAMAGGTPGGQPNANLAGPSKPVDSPPQNPSDEQAIYSGPPRAKLEGTIGDFKVRFYGTLLLNVSTSDSVQVGQDVPLWPLPGHVPITFPDGTTRRAGIVGDTIFTARQTVLGFQVGPAKPSDQGWTPSGVLEIDFFGSRPVDPTLQPQNRVFNQPRLRMAYLQLVKGTWRIVAGQDKIIISPLDPVSLSHVAYPLGASAGNLWGWLPQVRVENSRNFGSTTVLLQAGVLRPSFGDPRLGDQAGLVGGAVDAIFSGFGERANQPFYQARVTVLRPKTDAVATIGAGAHYGRERVGANRTLDSWAFSLDYRIPLHPRLILRGEGFVGSNLVPFDGGIIQGLAASPANPPFDAIHRIRAIGGWAELTIPFTLDYKNVFYVGAGTDDPKDRNLLPGTNRSKNSFLWASYFRKLTDEVTVALEWSYWDFQTRTFTPTGSPGTRGTPGRGNVFNLALAYQF